MSEKIMASQQHKRLSSQEWARGVTLTANPI